MDRDELARRLMATFLEEVDEHVRTLNRDLLALEKTPEGEERASLLRSLFRTVHSLKSASRSVQVPIVEAMCHGLEELLLPVRDGSGALSPEVVSLLFQAADALEDAARRLRNDESLAGSPAAALLDRVSASESPSAPVTPPAATPPAERADTAGTPAPTAAAGPEPARPASPQAPPPEPRPVPPVEPQEPDGRAAGAAPDYIRVGSDTLDLLLAHGGELRVARRRTIARRHDLEALRALAAHWEAEWTGTVERPLRHLLGNGAGDQLRTALPPRTVRTLGRTKDTVRRLRRDIDRLIEHVAADARAVDRAATPLEDELYRVRMRPFSEACEGLDRYCRDLGRSASKDVTLVVEGGAVEIDRSILQALRDPLRHLVRNAVDHGLETREARRAAGKSGTGRIELRATLRGDRVEVVVADDGRGIDLDAIRAQCERRKIPVPEDPRELTALLFASGFSTVRMLTQVSGRGVGLDVVKTQVESLHGSVDLQSEPGRGAHFHLVLPLTLTSIRVVLVKAGGQLLALPETTVLRLVRAGDDDLRSIEGKDVLLLPDGPVPAASLAEAAGLPASTAGPTGGKLPMVVVGTADKRMAFAVDELIDEQDVVVKPLGPQLRGLRHLSGATILPTGQVALVLNVAPVIRSALERSHGRRLSDALAEPERATRLRVLVVDDSVTTRTLEKTILEGSGFEVFSAADGQEAWEALQERGADLVVSDVEMPRMDGFELAETIRGSKRFRDLPVVLVTALESDRDKARGIEVGADAYLPKSAFDQKSLIDLIRQLV